MNKHTRKQLDNLKNACNARTSELSVVLQELGADFDLKEVLGFSHLLRSNAIIILGAVMIDKIQELEDKIEELKKAC